MNKTLLSIFETQGPISLDLANKNFSDEDIFEKFVDSSVFSEINFMNCLFEECEFLGANFYLCSFENCKFINTIIRKSEFADCTFKNCNFTDCEITPKTNFFRSSFITSQFSNIDLSWTFLSECKFIEINSNKIKLLGTSFVDPIIENSTFENLEFDQENPFRITIKNSSIFLKKTTE